MDIDNINSTKLSTSDDASKRSGKGLLRQKPQVHAEIVKLLEDGVSISEIGRRTGVKRATITAIRNGDSQTDAAWRRQTANRLKLVVSMTTDRMTEEIDDMAINTLPIATAITVDQIAKLENKPVAIIRHETVSTHESLNDKLDALEAEVVDVKVIEEKENDGQ